MATGAIVRVLRPLGHAVSFTAVAATPDDRLFVLAQQGADGQVSFAELRITSRHGGPPAARLSPALTHAEFPAGTQAYFMSVNAAGTRLALDAVAGNSAGSRLVVCNLASGRVMDTWAAGSGGVLTPPQFLSGGDVLAVDWPIVPTTGGRPGTLALRLVSTKKAVRPGTSLLADSQPDPRQIGVAGTFSQDGAVTMSTMDGAITAGQPGTGPTLTLLEVSATTGKLLHRIRVGPATALQGKYFCGVLWASANGRDLLTQCGTRQQEVAGGKVTVVRLAVLFPAQLDAPTSSFAW